MKVRTLSSIRRPSRTARDDRREVVVREHDVGRLARRLGAALAHGDADIGLAEGGGVVHPVAGHRDDVPARLPRPDETQLVRGRDPREDVSAGDRPHSASSSSAASSGPVSGSPPARSSACAIAAAVNG